MNHMLNLKNIPKASLNLLVKETIMMNSSTTMTEVEVDPQNFNQEMQLSTAGALSLMAFLAK